jgi:hypothetical protein
MRKSPILSLVVFLLLCEAGGGCMATPNLVAQVSPKPAGSKSFTPKAVIPRSTTPSSPKNSASPFVPGVTLPVFPGTTTIPALPSSSTVVQPSPSLPLVEVPTPGLRAAKIRKKAVPQSGIRRQRRQIEETPAPVRRRSNRSAN